MHTVGFCGLCSAPDTEANLQVFLLHVYTYRLCTIDQFTKAQNHLYITAAAYTIRFYLKNMLNSQRFPLQNSLKKNLQNFS